MALAAVTLYVASRTAAGALARGAIGRPAARRRTLAADRHHVRRRRPPAQARDRRRPRLLDQRGVAVVRARRADLHRADGPAARIAAGLAVRPAGGAAGAGCGFSGQFTWVHALAMLVLGGAVYSAWREAVARGESRAMPLAGVADAQPPARPWAILAEVLLAAALAAVGGWAAVSLACARRGDDPARLHAPRRRRGPHPLLALPMLSSVAPDKAGAHSSSMASTLVAVALLNLCGLLPLLTIIWHLTAGASASAAVAERVLPLRDVRDHRRRGDALPPGHLALDAVVLTVLGMAHGAGGAGPLGAGRWEAIGLVAGYALYLALSAAVSVKM
jgi:hypothetical protein